jgi:hypothetical protein
MCLETYKLDPAYYLSSPQLSWDAMLKHTGAKFKLLSDPAMFRIFDSGIRGGVVMISKRYARANNKSMGKDFDPNKPSVWIKGLDANNLYGWAMSQYLPYGGFQFLKEEEFASIDWLAQKDEQDIGYLVVADLQYPPELHDEHNDFPLAPERMIVKEEWLSDKQVNIRAQYNMPRGDSNTKLVPNLFDKHKYIVDYRNLKFYLDHGLKLGKIYAVIQYNQKPLMKSYIELNQERRQQAKTENQKNLFKLMNNAVFGKTCENQKKRTNIKLVNDKKKFEELCRKPEIMDVRIFEDNKDLCAVELQKLQINITKPNYVGFVILELAKLHMYRYVIIFFLTKMS